MRQNVPLVTFNRGIVSPLALARMDAKQIALAAEGQTNWIPRKLGPMSLRPGLGYTGATKSNGISRTLPFAYAIGDTARVELTPGIARFWVNDALVTFPSVATAITNGSFATDISSWTSNSDLGAYSVWQTGGYMVLGTLTPNKTAKRYQQVTVTGGDVGQLHALSFDVYVGTLVARVGSTLGGQEYIEDIELTQGVTTLAFTPTGNFYVQLMNKGMVPVWVSSVGVTTGVLEAATEWVTQAQFDALRVEQSGDVLFVTDGISRPKRIERRANGAWSVVNYLPVGGPYLGINTTEVTMTLSPSYAASGLRVQLQSSKPMFSPSHIGAMFRVEAKGQYVSSRFEEQNVSSEWIRVTGSGAFRAIGVNVDIDTAATLTVTLQRSLGEPGNWTDIASYAVDTVTTVTDALDNQTVYYRLACKTGDFTSGGAFGYLSYSQGITPIDVLITGYSSNLIVEGLQSRLPVYGTTVDWYEGAWSGVQGYPSAVALNESRLCWAGRSRFNGSIVNDYHGFDADYAGDAGPISRSIGYGMVDNVRWMCSVGRLIMGGESAEHSIRSSSIDEPLTPTNFNIKAYTNRGSSTANAVKVDSNIVFGDNSGKRVHILSPSDGGNYTAAEATLLSPEIGEPSITRIAVQHSPEVRVHCVRSDGKVALLVYDPVEEVQAWVLVETDGIIEDVVVLPAVGQSEVYYTVQRTVNGATVRYLEKWAHDADCIGGTINKQADAFVQFANSPASTTVSGLGHLIGESVVCWADGKDMGVFTVNGGGEITLPTAAAAGVVGLYYRARYKSVKLAHAAQGGTALTQTKRVDHIALIMANTHYQGLRYGPDFDTLDDLPLVDEGVETPADTVWEAYDQDSIEFSGVYDTDSRLCLEAAAPRPCTVLAAVISMKTNDKL